MAILAMSFAGCNGAVDASSFPSVRDLKPHQSLIMNVLICHRGCRANTVQFKEGHATLISSELKLNSEKRSEIEAHFLTNINFDPDRPIPNTSLKLTEKELVDLDAYFGSPLENCSNVIFINFLLKNENKVIASNDLEIYPCNSWKDQKITSNYLVGYLEGEWDFPIWRLTEKEQKEWEENYIRKLKE